MQKIFLSILIIMSLKSNLAQADEFILGCDEPRKPTPITRSMTPRDFVITGVVAGGSFEFVNFMRKDSRYKHIVQFGKRYPGFFVMGLSASIGTGLLYGQPVASFIKDRFAQNKQN